jgi:ribonuclease G
MFLKTIKNILGVSDSPKAELLISVEKLEKRVALIEGGRLEEFQVERAADVSIAGSVYKGRVKNIEPGLKAMFVDIGEDKNAFLHYWDAIPAALDNIEAISRGGTKRKQPRLKSDDIPKLYPPGSDVIVQVSKGPIGTKGARITTNISLPGRFLVLTPFTDTFGISRKIADPEERKRLRKILEKLEVPDGMGVIIRTVGEGQRARYFVRDLAFLLDQWKQIEKGMDSKRAPAALLREPGVVDRAVRDFLTDDVERIIIDAEEDYERVRNLVGQISRRSMRKVKLYQEPTPLFERFGVDRQLDSAFRREVQLKSGASIVIDETEALVAVDVNSGRSRGSGDEKGDTIVGANLEAADEVARQLRLRNIGGIIVVDFIDMRQQRDRNQVFQRLKTALRRDKARTNVLPISQLGLCEMTRQRTEESVRRQTYMPCPHCKGRGVIKTAETLSIELLRDIDRAMRHHPDIHEVRAVVHPMLLDRLRGQDEELLVALERKHAGMLAFRADPTLGPEDYKITNAQSGATLK